MKQFLVIGAGNFGSSVAMTLYELGHEVMVVDQDEDAIKRITDHVTHAIQGNAADERTIKALGAENFDVVIMSVTSDMQSSILTTILLKESGADYVIAKAQNDLHAKVLYKVGVDKVVFPERDMGVRLAQSLSKNNIMDYIELNPEYSIVEISALREWVGKSLIELNIRKRYGINIIAIKRNRDINLSPNASTIISEEDVLIVIGHNKDLNEI